MPSCNPSTTPRNFSSVFAIVIGLILLQNIYVNGRPAPAAQSANKQDVERREPDETGYNYPVPENPLKFPDRKTTVSTQVRLLYN